MQSEAPGTRKRNREPRWVYDNGKFLRPKGVAEDIYGLGRPARYAKSAFW
jgi:hypothetical protein